jgi:hypothetical protein
MFIFGVTVVLYFIKIKMFIFGVTVVLYFIKILHELWIMYQPGLIL